MAVQNIVRFLSVTWDKHSGLKKWFTLTQQTKIDTDEFIIEYLTFLFYFLQFVWLNVVQWFFFYESM